MQLKENPPTEVGVVIGRFQVDDLHQSHIKLIDFVKSRHSKVIILLGCSRVPGTRRYPLDFDARRLMIQEKYPDIIVLPIMNQRTDEGWSKAVDSLLREVLGPGQTPTLYGSRDSFIPYYEGKFSTQELDDPDHVFGMSGTMVRKRLASTVQANKGFRAGAIWQAYNRFPLVISTVDIAVVDFTNDRLLLGRKPGESKWRFVGGFADPRSESDEVDAARETMEETGLSVGPMYYLGSFNINDWRYADEADQIRTRFFFAQYISGVPTANDDIEELRWFPLTDKIYAELNEEHHALLHELFMAFNIESHKYHKLVETIKKFATNKE